MTPYKAPVDDILFALNLAGAGTLPDWNEDMTREILGHFGRFAEDRLAPLDEPGDRQGCRIESGRVRMPDGFAEAWAELVEQGWHAIGLPERWGGQQLPAPLLGAISEVFAGANHSLQMVPALVPGVARTILNFGTDAQKERWLPRLATGDWLTAMALTEPGAGSDLSGIRTRAIQGGDHWVLEGEKIFISGGDQDLSPHILHLVLARTGRPEDGTRGLSLFLTPSTDDSGARSTISVTRIEEKLGLHGSPTCQMSYDGAKAELLGDLGGGLRAMFTLMNHARLEVSLHGLAHATRASHIARAYAAERSQGGKTLDRHADVRRMLEEADALSLCGRVVTLTAMTELQRNGDTPLVDFLTPVAKVMGTDAGIRAADLAIQVLGGYGYVREYRVEQTWRDARITSIYEGANGIHARQLATRGLRHGGGAAADAFDAMIAETPELATELDLWRQARQRLTASDDPEAEAHAFMQLTITLALAQAAQRLGAAAAASPDPERYARTAAFVAGRTPALAAFWAAQC